MTPAAPLAAALLAAITASSWVLTGWFRQYAISRRMVDVPNARSSHRVATPRGGGGAIVVASSAALAWWAWASGSPVLFGVLVGGLCVALVGFVDDHRHVSPVIRLVGHSIASVVAVASIDDTSVLTGGSAGMMGLAGALVAMVFVAWLINLTNFMDGIDGIAGVQMVTVCAAAAGLCAMAAPGTGLWFEPAVLAAASIGFLIWNWPPARVFMGDVGSGFIGYMVAVMTLRSALVSPVLGWCWLILSGVFIVDATWTLARRVARRDQLFQAHRSHAYQCLALVYGHLPVTLLVAAINLCWLTPVALLVALGYLTGPAGLLLAYLPLTVGAFRYGARTAARL